MLSKKEKIIAILAISVLLVGVFSSLYVNATQVNKDTITINGKTFGQAKAVFDVTLAAPPDLGINGQGDGGATESFGTLNQ